MARELTLHIIIERKGFGAGMVVYINVITSTQNQPSGILKTLYKNTREKNLDNERKEGSRIMMLGVAIL